jgi:hypothetical protein
MLDEDLMFALVWARNIFEAADTFTEEFDYTIRSITRE